MPSMRGRLVTEEVQPGLLLSAFDVTFTADCRVKVELEPSITCGILLMGNGEPLEIGDRPPLAHEVERVQVVGLGERQQCVRPWYAGQRAQVFSVTIKPRFFDRFGNELDDRGLATLRGFLDPGVHAANLPWSWGIVDLAKTAMDEPYSGSLLSLFRETHALRFTLEIASLLREEARLAKEMGRRQYGRACQAREILDRALINPPKLLELARQLGVNVTTLQENFRAAFGTTIFNYVRNRRLEMARILIREHGLGAAEAGYKVGFSSASAFSTAYRRTFGYVPSHERRSAAH